MKSTIKNKQTPAYPVLMKSPALGNIYIVTGKSSGVLVHKVHGTGYIGQHCGLDVSELIEYSGEVKLSN